MTRNTPQSHQPLKVLQNISITAATVFCFTFILIMASGAPPFKAFFYIFKGSLGSWVKLSHVIQAWVPLTLCACGLLYTFRIGLWNIGIEGQMIMGAVFSTAVLRLGTQSAFPWFVLILSFVAGVIGGGLWAVIAGFLKTRSGVNEIFAGLGLNFVAQGIILWLIFGPWKRPGVASMSGTEVFPTELWLGTIKSLRLAPVGVGFAVLAIITSAILLRYSSIGLRLRAIGSNSHASYLFGMKPNQYMLLAMLLAGGFAGLAGNLQVTGVYHRLLPAISSNYGYLALLVVMLADYKVWAVPAIAFFFACLNVGSIQLPMVLQVDSSLSGVIQGALVLATLALSGWRRFQTAN
ncbi:MAG: ABC transporter permease [Desulfobacterales bacterium]|nr:ABC transporter permease [Desulfobacterales bacterium]